MSAPDCYACIHRRSIPGDAHSRCDHPEAQNYGGLVALGIAGHQHGQNSGWFDWPRNFDPRWLLSCSGFEDVCK